MWQFPIGWYQFLSHVESARIVVRPGNLSQLSAGDTLTLSCVGYGNPLPSVFWSRSDTNQVLINSSRITIFEETLSQSGVTFVKSILQVCSVQPSMTGEYSCTSRNEIGNETATFQLTVNDGMHKILCVLQVLNNFHFNWQSTMACTKSFVCCRC